MKTRLATALLALLPGALGAAPAPSVTTQLPRDVRPVHYDVALKPDAAAATFAGQVGIDLEVTAPTRRIVLNAADLKIASAKLTTMMRIAPFGAPQIALDAEAQTATFTFDRDLVPGRYRLDLDYTGVIGTQAAGLFSLDYDTPQGKRRALYTQFENSDARRVIPSWDEPSYKATFTLTADVPAAQMAVSNMPVASRTATGDRARVTFAPSPKMSTYLLFFGLGEFERATAKAGPTEVGVVTKLGATSQAQFALDSSVRVLNEYNDYFGTPYPLPKLDNVAAPGRSQFFSAMENWGAIFTFEYSLLLDPAYSTQEDRQRSFLVAAHEIAHQWFGDLVTMAWWDDLWLNEGFASWMESRTTAKLHPEWNTRLEWVLTREAAMNQDALATTHPVIQKIATVEQASQAFDSITYNKGASVIRMLEAYAGADAWRDGVRRYMKRHAYGNTVSDDLWAEIDKGGKPVSAIAHQFTLQPGVPMISVATRCSGGMTEVTLTQGQFSKDKQTAPPLKWDVPVTLQGSGAPVTTLVSGGRGTVRVPGCGAVVVNAGQAGYFRTLYARPDFAALDKGVARLDPIDQLGLLGDSWALGLAGLQPAPDALALAQRLPADADPQIWGRVAQILVQLDDYARGDPRRATFRAFARRLLAPVLTRVGWEARPGDAPTVATLRAQLIGALGGFDDPAVVAEARRRYAAGDAALPTPIRQAVQQVVARRADAATWERLRGEAKAAPTAIIKDDLYFLLGVADDPALAQRALDLALTDEPGATNSSGIISAVAREHPELAFDFAVARKPQVDKVVDSSSRSRFYAALAGRSGDAALIPRLRRYAGANVVATSQRPVDEAVARIEDRVRVKRDRLPAIEAWLKTAG